VNRAKRIKRKCIGLHGYRHAMLLEDIHSVRRAPIRLFILAVMGWLILSGLK
jgi:hypothetical protein